MYFRFIFGFIIISMMQGCLTQADQQQHAGKMINQLHQAIQLQQWDNAIQLFDPSFFKSEPQNIWKQKLITLQDTLGAIKGFNIISSSKDPRFGGDFYIYIISVQHEHGFSHETITIFKGLDERPLMVTGYQIRAQKNQ
ncbi:MAG: hypothetical protein Q9M20_03855 [Mariprofundaceae bacterium]|nr:hypothetical protein [Mariprofundaceae bacterium]